MLLSRESNLRCNVVEWLVENLSMTIDEAVEVVLRYHFNAESVQHSFDIPDKDINKLMV